MAIRRHIAAALDVSKDAFERTFATVFGARLQDDAVTQEGRWTYVMASVWGTAGAELDAALQKLDAPALRVTTEDATRWYLLLFGSGQEPFVACHEFSYLSRGEDGLEVETEDAMAFLLDDAAPRTRPFDAVAEDLESLGCPLPTDLVQRLREKSVGEAIGGMLRWQAGTICDALERFGMPHDRDEIHAILAGDAATETERDWDIGNLPRFLVALGFAGQWRELVEQAENPEAYVAAEAQEDAAQTALEDQEQDFIMPVLQMFQENVGEVQPVPVAGGVVAWPLQELPQVRRIADFCGEGTNMVLVATHPGGFDVEQLKPSARGLQLRPLPDDSGASRRIGIAFMETSNIEEEEQTAACTNLLRALPAGATLEVITSKATHFLSVGESLSCSHQIYRGPVLDGVWHIEATYPPVGKAALAGALALAREVGAQEKQQQENVALMAHSEDEAQSILRATAHSFNFEDDRPRRDGLRIIVDNWQLDDLATLFFRARFRATWDVSAAEAEEAEQWREHQRFLQSVNAPHADEVILESAVAIFYRADIRHLRELDEQELEIAENAMQALGLQSLGDLVCDASKQVTLRGYCLPDGCVFGVHMQTMAGDAYTEFYTLFEDGSSLTTTTNENATLYPEQGLYTLTYEDLDPRELYEKHRRGIEKFRAHKHTMPRRIEPTLQGLAWAIAEFLERREKATEGMMQLVSFSIPLEQESDQG